MWADVDRRSEIIAITNAIHLPTWVDKGMLDAAEEGEGIWERHMENKRALVEFVKERNGVTLDAEKLIVGFSRRAAPYKRSDLIFAEPEIVEPLLKEGTLQLVFSGKAHPLDDRGKGIVENLVAMSKKYPNSVVFLQNYGMEIGAMLTRGSDVWLNNPVRPLEASGTSGMKASLNGVLNFSILDGWWPEACNHGVNGFQFGDGFEAEDWDEATAHDLPELYRVLLEELMPTYYGDRDKWVEMMRESIQSTRDYFAVKRMLEEYYSKMYIKNA
jgi:starch phosphorylase